MSKTLLLLSALLISSTKVLSECLTANDIIINETDVDTATQNLIEGSTRFSFELFRTLNDYRRGDKDAKSLFFSPYSIWSDLIVTYMGAQGRTEQEMRKVLGIGDSDKSTTWKAFSNIRNLTLNNKVHRDTGYKSANRIYFQDGRTFQNRLREIMNNDIAFLDFKSNVRESRKTINTWVEKQTQQRVKGLIPPGGIKSRTNMVIVDTVYFKEAWLQPFDPDRNTRGRFMAPFGNRISVTMMTGEGVFLYGKNDELDCYAIELSYDENILSMIILLPKDRYRGVDIVSNNLTFERLRNLFSGMYHRHVVVSIPKFKLGDSFELSSNLKKIGLKTLFNRRRSDLSGFTGISEFTVDKIYHKAVIDVNEEGTEAAAATAVRMLPKQRLKFIADYPFIYFIKNNLSNAILFLGTVQKPPRYSSS